MNEYTRGEEVRSTLIASVILILCVAAAVILLVSAKGKVIPDPAARAAAKAAEEKSTKAQTCTVASERLGEFRDVAGDLFDGRPARHRGGSAVAAQVDADQPEALGQLALLTEEAAMGHQPVQ